MEAVRRGRRRAVAAARTTNGAGSRPPLLDALFTPFPPVRGGLALLRAAAGRRRAAAGPAAGAAGRAGSARRCSPVRARRCCWPAAPCTPTCRPRRPAAAVYGWLLAMLGQEVGWPVPDGGAQRITDALVDRLTSARRPDRVRRPRRPGAGRARPGDGGPDGGRRRLCGPGGRCWPTCPRRRSTSTWSAAPHLPPRLVEDLDALPLGRRHAQGRLGAVRAGAVEEPGRRRRRHRAPRRRPRRAHPLRRPTSRPGERAARPVPARRPDDHRRPEPLAGRHRVALGVHPSAVPDAAGSAAEVAGHAARMEEVLEEHAPGFGRSVAGPPRRRAGRPGRRATRASWAARWAAAPRRRTSSCSCARSPAWAGPTPRSTGSSWPARRRTRAAVCTARPARTRRGRRWPATAP